MGNRLYKHNDDIFSMEDERSFYLAGFIAADGCVMKPETRHILKIKLALKDENQLLMIKKLCDANNPIYYAHNKKENTNNVSLVICSKKIVYDLEKFNIVPRKTLIYSMPEWLIKHKYIHHFLRGYIDGDGSFYIKKTINQPDQIGFSLCGTKIFLYQFKNIVENYCKFNIYTIKQKKSIYELLFSGTYKIANFVNFLYKDATIYLPRKKDIAFKSFDFCKRDKYKRKNNIQYVEAVNV